MTRDEFLGRLGELLACLPAEQVEEAKAFYAEAIADRMEDGMTEEEAVAAMGTPGEAAEATLDELPAVPRAIARTRRRSTALLWVLAIVGSPVWVPLLLAFAAVAVTVYVCIWVLALCVWVIAACLGAVGVTNLALMTVGFKLGLIPYALATLGCGIALLGAALLVGAGAWAVSKQIARLSALWARKALSPFWKSRGEKNAEASARTERVAGVMASAKRIYLAVAGGLVAAGLVLAGIGYVASGCNPAVFTTQLDARSGEIVLGGVEVEGPIGMYNLDRIFGLGDIDTSGVAAPEAPAAP